MNLVERNDKGLSLRKIILDGRKNGIDLLKNHVPQNENVIKRYTPSGLISNDSLKEDDEPNEKWMEMHS